MNRGNAIRSASAVRARPRFQSTRGAGISGMYNSRVWRSCVFAPCSDGTVRCLTAGCIGEASLYSLARSGEIWREYPMISKNSKVQSLFDARVAIYDTSRYNYPKQPPFHPPELYPEYPFNAHRSITRIMYMMLCDNYSFCCVWISNTTVR